MLMESPSQFDLEIQQLILAAERVLIDAQTIRESSGLGGDDARTQLERRLSPADVAEVDAAVQDEIERIKQNVQLHSMNRDRTTTTAPTSRHSRQMI